MSKSKGKGKEREKQSEDNSDVLPSGHTTATATPILKTKRRKNAPASLPGPTVSSRDSPSTSDDEPGITVKLRPNKKGLRIDAVRVAVLTVIAVKIQLTILSESLSVLRLTLCDYFRTTHGLIAARHPVRRALFDRVISTRIAKW